MSKIRFSLRTLLLFTAIPAVVLGLLVSPGEQQRRRVLRLERAGGIVRYEDRLYFARAHERSWFVDWHTDVDTVRLWDADLNEETVSLLEGFPKLRALDLSYNPHVTDQSLVYLKRLPVVEDINLSSTKVTNAGLSRVITLPGLKSLHVSGPAIDDVGVATIGQCSQLKTLKLGDTQLTDNGLEALIGLAQLEGLNLDGTKVTDAGLSSLRLMPNLRWLSLNNTAVSDGGMEHVGMLTQLESLWLYETHVGDHGIGHLKSLENLRILHIGKTAVTDRGAKELCALQGLEWVYMFGTAVTDDGFESLSSLPRLKTVNVDNCNVTPAAVHRLKERLPECDISGESAKRGSAHQIPCR